MPVQGKCTKCGYISSQELCKACILLQGLNKGRPRLAVGKKKHVVSGLAEAATPLDSYVLSADRTSSDNPGDVGLPGRTSYLQLSRSSLAS